MKKVLDYLLVLIVGIVIGTGIAQYQNKPPKRIDGGTPWSNGFDDKFGCNTESITKMYEGYVEEWKKDASYSFDSAESKVYNITPTPDIVGPHEDPEKCICKGTGVIKQGDGHTTVCPYHGKTFNNPLLILEE